MTKNLVCVSLVTLYSEYNIMMFPQAVNSTDADKKDKYSKQALYGGVCALICGIVSFAILLGLFLAVRFAAAAAESSTTSPDY